MNVARQIFTENLRETWKVNKKSIKKIFNGKLIGDFFHRCKLKSAHKSFRNSPVSQREGSPEDAHSVEERKF